MDGLPSSLGFPAVDINPNFDAEHICGSTSYKIDANVDITDKFTIDSSNLEIDIVNDIFQQY